MIGFARPEGGASNGRPQLPLLEQRHVQRLAHGHQFGVRIFLSFAGEN
jgi:hypothetical protein